MSPASEDWWSTPASRPYKQRLNAVVHVHRDDGPSQAFGPDDEVPDWAKDKIGRHAWAGQEAPHVPADTLETVTGRLHVDGKPAFIDVLCKGGGNNPDHEPILVARFEAATFLEAPPDGPPHFEWWWTGSLNGPAGAFAGKSHVSWSDRGRPDWESTGAGVGFLGVSHPAPDQPIEIECGVPVRQQGLPQLQTCRLALDRRWADVELALDKCRHAGLPELDFASFIRTICR